MSGSGNRFDDIMGGGDDDDKSSDVIESGDDSKGEEGTEESTTSDTQLLDSNETTNSEAEISDIPVDVGETSEQSDHSNQASRHSLTVPNEDVWDEFVRFRHLCLAAAAVEGGNEEIGKQDITTAFLSEGIETLDPAEVARSAQQQSE